MIDGGEGFRTHHAISSKRERGRRGNGNQSPTTLHYSLKHRRRAEARKSRPPLQLFGDVEKRRRRAILGIQNLDGQRHAYQTTQIYMTGGGTYQR